MKIDKSKFSVMDDRYQVNAISTIPDHTIAFMVLGHGAGAGMEHKFMSKLAHNLAEVGIGTLRYNFPYIEQGRRTPTSPGISEATVRAAVDHTRLITPIDKLLVGGKSYGGRMSSQAQSKDPLPGVSGLVFFGFPLHAPGKPGDSRGAHLHDIEIPLLFLQGSRDALADLELLSPLISSLQAKATLEVIQGADHSFNMLKSADKTSDEAQNDLVLLTANWVNNLKNE